MKAIRFRAAISRGLVIVPMTFDDPEYFADITTGVASSGREVRVVRLYASSETLLARLELRERETGEPVTPWVLRRLGECAEAFQVGYFGVPVDTEGRSPDQVAEHICELIGHVRAA